ncbi:hypothetical protein ARMGADRAFT_1169092 [Armillaria gallica]|uniref:Uncharacterized protein n=1 Tax=Armillaria gallica TaxID=47427 RepID=A0A2H3DEF7_ARMGA|nr:hypothetical protein ARMGADRAFT_1169092 [Armillaria gallica]
MIARIRTDSFWATFDVPLHQDSLGKQESQESRSRGLPLSILRLSSPDIALIRITYLDFNRGVVYLRCPSLASLWIHTKLSCSKDPGQHWLWMPRSEAHCPLGYLCRILKLERLILFPRLSYTCPILDPGLQASGLLFCCSNRDDYVPIRCMPDVLTSISPATIKLGPETSSVAGYPLPIAEGVEPILKHPNAVTAGIIGRGTADDVMENN